MVAEAVLKNAKIMTVLTIINSVSSIDLIEDFCERQQKISGYPILLIFTLSSLLGSVYS